MAESNVYPFDPQEIERGQLISNDRIADMLGVPVNHSDFWKAVLKIKTIIENTRGFTCRCEMAHGIRVLTEDEAAPYQNHRNDLHLAGVNRSFDKMRAIKQTDLSDKILANHVRNLVNKSRIVQAMREEVRVVRLVEAKKDLKRISESS